MISIVRGLDLVEMLTSESGEFSRALCRRQPHANPLEQNNF